MTLTVKIKNDGNQPNDSFTLRGVKTEEGYSTITGNLHDSTTVLQGEEITVYPNNGHYDDFQLMEIKGKH